MVFKGLQSENVCAKEVAHSAVKVGIIVESFMVKKVLEDEFDEMSLVFESRSVLIVAAGDCGENRAHLHKAVFGMRKQGCPT